jgi:hypothetical protein
VKTLAGRAADVPPLPAQRVLAAERLAAEADEDRRHVRGAAHRALRLRVAADAGVLVGGRAAGERRGDARAVGGPDDDHVDRRRRAENGVDEHRGHDVGEEVRPEREQRAGEPAERHLGDVLEGGPERLRAAGAGLVVEVRLRHGVHLVVAARRHR